MEDPDDDLLESEEAELPGTDMELEEVDEDDIEEVEDDSDLDDEEESADPWEEPNDYELD